MRKTLLLLICLLILVPNVLADYLRDGQAALVPDSQSANQFLPDSVLGGAEHARSVVVGGGRNERPYWNLDLRNVSFNNETYLNVYVNAQGAGSDFLVFYYFINYTNATNLTWNNQPCGTTISGTGGSCNNTVLKNISTGSMTGWITVNITQFVQQEQLSGDKKFSIMARYNKESIDGSYDYETTFRTPNGTVQTERPFINNTGSSGFGGYVNFTVYDEILGKPNKITQSTTIDFISDTQARSFTTTSGSVLVDQVFSTEYRIRYSTANYGPRDYYSTFTSQEISNSSLKALDGFLLSNGNSTSVTVNVLNKNADPIENALVQLERMYINATPQWKPVAMVKTDSQGVSTFDVDFDDAFYRFNVSKGNIAIQTTPAEITDTSIFITLDVDTTQNASRFAGINYYFKPQSPLYFNTTYNFSVNLSSTFWTLTACTFNIKNSTSTFATSTGYTSSNCALNITFNTGNYSSIYTEVTYTINNTFTDSYNQQYAILFFTNQNFTLKDALDDLRLFQGAGFNQFTLFIMAFVCIFAITGSLAYNFNELRQPEPVLIIIWSLVLLFSYVGWLTIELPGAPTIGSSNPNYIQQYGILVLTTLSIVAIYLRRNH